jgi:phosphatidylglycerol---prolipoprotein diacylglyceryl transferase
MLPIINKLFHLTNYEGIFFFTAILSALIYFSYLAKEENLNLDMMYEACFISLLSALVMGRLFSLVFWEAKYFFAHPWIFFMIWKYSGISVTGGVIGGLVTGYIYAVVKKLHFFHHVRLFIPPITVGQIIGRFGCFLNGDAGGITTKMPWGIVFKADSVAYTGKIIPGSALHPTQIYEITGSLILFFALVLTGNNKWISNRRIIWYALFYSVIRFITEIFRSDTEKWKWIPVFSTGQIICILGFITGAALLIWSLFNNDKMIARQENIALMPSMTDEKPVKEEK